MVNSRWVPVTITVLALASLMSPARADGATTPDPRTTPEVSQQIRVQPVLPAGRDLDADRLRSVVDRVASWAQSTSAGTWRISYAGLRPRLDVRGDDCSALIREVALDRHVTQADGDVTVYVGDARDCPYLGLAETPGSWVLMPRMNAADDAIARTLAHELGHTLGLQHAGAQTCAVLQAAPRGRSQDCGVAEYGDYTDPMGRGSLAWSLGPIARAYLGWAELTDVAGNGEHRIRLRGEEAIRISDPATDTTYVVAHRRPGSGESDRSAGIHLYRLPHAHEHEVSSVHLPWIAAPSRPWGGRAGMAFVSPSGSVGVQVRSIDGDTAEITVTIDSRGGIADTWGPVFAEAHPTITWRGRTARVQVPRAFDQSGVARYVVTVGDRVHTSQRVEPGIDTWQVRLPRSAARSRDITVQAIDGAGNTTTVALDGRRSGR